LIAHPCASASEQVMSRRNCTRRASRAIALAWTKSSARPGRERKRSSASSSAAAGQARAFAAVRVSHPLAPPLLRGVYRRKPMRTEPTVQKKVALEELGEAKRTLELAKEVMVRAMMTPGRLASVAEAAAARRLLDEAKA